ncbi:Histone-lysine N-methyltransferase SMYD3 [Apodemus speciosus]|uniref:Histone-lysine N-methyltransferase SMYD3 n=1 Tax=Apodemus speciosus TaxID=105296 RepID=A0ABQ0EFB4_APOSI
MIQHGICHNWPHGGSSLYIQQQIRQYIRQMEVSLQQGNSDTCNDVGEPDEITLNEINRPSKAGVICNSFTICNAEMQEVGVGLYPSMSLLNHSCDPNCSIVFNGPHLLLRAVREIEAGEELTICYLDMLMTSEERRKQLRDQYCFEVTVSDAKCRTRLLRGDAEMLTGDEQIWKEVQESLKTIEELKAHWSILSPAGPDPRATPLCKIMGASSLPCLEALQPFRRLRLPLCFLDEDNESLTKLITEWEQVLALCQAIINSNSKRLPDSNVYQLKVLDCAMDACINLGMLEEALSYAMRTMEPYRIFFPGSHPVRGVQVMKVGKLQLHQGMFPQAMKNLRLAFDIMKVTHGREHSLIEDLILLLEECDANIRAS